VAEVLLEGAVCCLLLCVEAVEGLLLLVMLVLRDCQLLQVSRCGCGYEDTARVQDGMQKRRHVCAEGGKR
jgi:hypothetical protein